MVKRDECGDAFEVRLCDDSEASEPKPAARSKCATTCESKCYQHENFLNTNLNSNDLPDLLQRRRSNKGTNRRRTDTRLVSQTSNSCKISTSAFQVSATRP